MGPVAIQLGPPTIPKVGSCLRRLLKQIMGLEEDQSDDDTDASDNTPSDWWGGMDRSCYLCKKEKRPLFLSSSQVKEKVIEPKFTGLVFINGDSDTTVQQADLFVSGERVCKVMEFTSTKRKEYHYEKLVKEVDYIPLATVYYRRLKRNAKKESREFYWGCMCSIFYSMCSWCFLCFITTVLLALCFIILKIVGYNNCKLFSHICLLFVFICSGRFFFGNMFEMPMILFSLVVSLIGYYYSDSSMYWSDAFMAVNYFIIVSELFCLDQFVNIPEAAHAIKILVFIVPFLLK